MFDMVAGNILIETRAAPLGQTFTVSYPNGLPDTYTVRQISGAALTKFREPDQKQPVGAVSLSLM
jgi:hypothetical protein